MRPNKDRTTRFPMRCTAGLATAFLSLLLGFSPIANRAEAPIPNGPSGEFRVENRGAVWTGPATWVAQPAGRLAYGSGREVVLAGSTDPAGISARVEMPAEVTGAVSLGNFLYLGLRDTGLGLLDATDPAQAEVAVTQSLPGSRFLPGADGNVLAVLSEGVGLYRFQLRNVHHGNPIEGVIPDFLPLMADVSGMVILESRAFVALTEGGVVVVDLSPENPPAVTGTIETSEPLRALAASGFALLAQGVSGALYSIDPQDSSSALLASTGVPPAQSLLAAGRALYVAGPGGVTSLSAGRNEAATVTVKVGNTFFNPQSVTLAPGDTVHWQWVGGTHSTTSGSCNANGCAPDGTWDSGNKSSGTFDRVFATAGTFPYFCKIHQSSMTGTVVVQAAQPCTLSCGASATPASGTAPLTVAFNATGDAQHCDGVIAYAWNFGDGATASTQAASHTYATGGTFTWTLTATIQDQVCTKTGSITVAAPPVCSVTCTASTSSPTGPAPFAVGFAASATTTNCAGTPGYHWDFGDGSSSDAQNPTHIFVAAGSYTWTLTVSVDGQTCSKTGTVTATAPCQVTCDASAAPAAGPAPLTVTFTGSATAVGCTGAPSYSWAFGDSAVSVEQNPAHTYGSVGTYTWTFTASADGVTCAKTGTITALGSGPLPGDCDGNGNVSIGEVQRAISMFLGTQADACGVDCSRDGTVSVGEVQKVINAFLGLPASC